ncbi:50S ribosomal protein L24 [Patescibacteria group bacterium AH-259-L05]|nr:50S ribosomal protein L24 [Patescibacteria group bacterium AH-259-L05]
MNMKIRKDDTVQVIAGKDRGKKGRVLRSLPKKNKVVLEGLNLVVKHVRPRRQGEKGQRIKMATPLDTSSVKLICPKCKKAMRVGYKILANKKKKRFCRRCKGVF